MMQTKPTTAVVENEGRASNHQQKTLKIILNNRFKRTNEERTNVRSRLKPTMTESCYLKQLQWALECC